MSGMKFVILSYIGGIGRVQSLILRQSFTASVYNSLENQRLYL